MAESFSSIDFINELPIGARHNYWDALSAKAKELEPAGPTVSLAVTRLVSSVTAYGMDTDNIGCPYRPAVVWADGSHSGTHEDLSDFELRLAEEILDKVSQPLVLSRLADVLWLRRRSPVSLAHRAFEAFLLSGSELMKSGDWPYCDAEFSRAFALSKSLGRGGLEMQTKARVATSTALAAGPPPAAELRLMRLLCEFGMGDEAPGLRSRCREAADSLIADGDSRSARAYLEMGARLASLDGDRVGSRALAVESAELAVTEAYASLDGDDPSYFRAVFGMQEAIKELRRIGGMRARIDELHADMVVWEEHMSAEMTEISIPFDGTAFVETGEKAVKGATAAHALVGLAFRAAMLLDPEAMARQAEELAEEAPLSHLISTFTVNQRGRWTAVGSSMLSNDSEERRRGLDEHTFKAGAEYATLVASTSIEAARLGLLSNYAIRYIDLLDLLGPSPFIPPGHERAYVHGVYAILCGNFISGAHILSAQLEAAVRYAMESAGALPALLSSGVQNELTLNTLLESDQAIEVFGSEMTFTLRCVLCERYGFNLRNLLAHGLVTDEAYFVPSVIYLWWLAVRAAVAPMIDWSGGENAEPG